MSRDVGKPPLAVAILSDGRPGHFHLSEGVAAAIARRRPIALSRLDVRRARMAPTRVLAALCAAGCGRAALRLGYGLGSEALGSPAIVISAGGDTIAANAAAAALSGAANIYCGTLKHVAIERFSLVVSSYERHRSLPRHLVTLKPSAIPRVRARLPGRHADRAPAVTGLLVGGDSGLFKYEREEWEQLLELVRRIHAAHGTRWIASTSRRTAAWVADVLGGMAAEADGPIATVIDYRTAGPGTLAGLFSRVDAILATADSSTMISEAVSAGLPVVGLSPRRSSFKDEEGEYRAFMERSGWARFAALAGMSPARFAALVAEIVPLAEDPLDRLAAELAARLPGLGMGD